MASVILAPIRLKFELVIYILSYNDHFVKYKFKKTNFFGYFVEETKFLC